MARLGQLAVTVRTFGSVTLQRDLEAKEPGRNNGFRTGHESLGNKVFVIGRGVR